MANLTVRQFVFQMYRLISASNPTVPLHGDDQALAIQVINQILESFAASGLLLTIAQEVNIPLTIGQQTVTCGPASVPPAPNIYDINMGRMANLTAAWLLLDGVTYPLIDKSRDEFLSSFKYDPLQGLPRFIIVYPNTEFVSIRLYPAPSQYFQFYLRAKFQLTDLNANTDLSSLPIYYQRFLLYEGARDVAMFTGRADAWTEKLEMMRVEAKDQMEGASEVNLSITGDRASLLNGAWRVKAGI